MFVVTQVAMCLCSTYTISIKVVVLESMLDAILFNLKKFDDDFTDGDTYVQQRVGGCCDDERHRL